MKRKEKFIGLVVAVMMLVPSGLAWAGGEGQPPAAGISGPELWAVVVINCTSDLASLRVKRINNCEVETDAFLVGNFSLCPSSAADALYYQLTGISLSGMGITGTPIITRAKNFQSKTEGSVNTVSFDAQIRSTP